jgi:hypothetical protein
MKSSPLEAALIELARFSHIQNAFEIVLSQEVQVIGTVLLSSKISDEGMKPRISPANGPSSPL